MRYEDIEGVVGAGEDTGAGGNLYASRCAGRWSGGATHDVQGGVLGIAIGIEKQDLDGDEGVGVM